MTAKHRNGVLLWIAYDGSCFHGMAHQSHVRTVAGALQTAIVEMDGHASCIRQASRTDAGVHAEQQVVAFDTSKDIPPRGWALGLSKYLPREVSVTAASTVPTGFDPRDFAVSKTYRYQILRSQVRDPFLERRAWRVGERLNHAAMLDEASQLLGQHDFAAFRSANDRRSDTRRELTKISLEPDPSNGRVLWWTIEGDRFLMHMIRIIVGTLVDIGRGRIAPGACARALASCRREDLGVTAPSMGLYLHRVELTERGTDRWPQVDEAALVT
jgi:tRNA pseudouridine38-40 synthase